MNYASIKNYDIANGEGIRVSIFVSGCPHHCKNCFNKEAWDPNYGDKFTEEEVNDILNMLKKEYISGISLLGGEPFYKNNKGALLPLLREIKKNYPNKTIWCYTGYLFDKEILEEMIYKEKATKEFLSYIDVLVDGRFIEKYKSAKLVFRGSSNQRIIDVAKSLEKNKVIEYKLKEE